MSYVQDMEAKGHLVDSGIMAQVFDTIVKDNGGFKIKKFVMGKTNTEPSVTEIQVAAKSKEQLDQIVGKLHVLGCYLKKEEEAVIKKSEKNSTVPNDFYSTTNHKTLVRYKGKWLVVKNQRMDTPIVIINNKGKQEARCVLLRDIKKNNMIITGLKGVKVVPEFKERERDDFSFMENEISSERKVDIAVKRLARFMKDIKRKKGRIAVVAGPVVIHTGGGKALASLIRKGYVNTLLSNNALAVHDIEQALYNTALGIDINTGKQVSHGHKNHMAAINQVNKWGSITAGVKSGKLKSGIMHECIKKNIGFALAASIRDDGPLPDVTTDMIKAQEEYGKLLKGIDLVIMLSTMLHSIGAGNMLPSYVKTICIDINPAVVTKLADRGSNQALGIVTDVGLFLNLLDKEL